MFKSAISLALSLQLVSGGAVFAEEGKTTARTPQQSNDPANFQPEALKAHLIETAKKYPDMVYYLPNHERTTSEAVLASGQTHVFMSRGENGPKHEFKSVVKDGTNSITLAVYTPDWRKVDGKAVHLDGAPGKYDKKVGLHNLAKLEAADEFLEKELASEMQVFNKKNAKMDRQVAQSEGGSVGFGWELGVGVVILGVVMGIGSSVNNGGVTPRGGSAMPAIAGIVVIGFLILFFYDKYNEESDRDFYRRQNREAATSRANDDQ